MRKTIAGRVSSRILSAESTVIGYDTIDVDSLKINSDGDIFFLTSSSYYRGQYLPTSGSLYKGWMTLVKIDAATGDINETFMTNMGWQAANNTTEGYIISYDIDPNTDDIVITGSFRIWNGSAINHTGVIRVTKTGTLVSAFNTALGNGLQQGYRGEFTGQVTGMTTDVYIISVEYNNSSIALNFNGSNSIDTVIAAYNAANPTAIVLLGADDDGTQIPDNGQTITIPAATTAVKCLTDKEYRCKFLANGKVLIMGYYNGWNNNYSHQSGLILLNSDGTINTTFSDNVAYALDTYWVNSQVFNAVELSTGAIILWGDWAYSVDAQDNQGWDNSGVNRIIKVSSFGVVDSTFATNAGEGLDDYPLSIAVDGSDNLYIGGYQSEYNGVGIPSYLTKLSSAGVLDTTFNENLGQFQYYGFSYRIVDVKLDGTDIIVGGNFDELFLGDTVPEYIGTPAGCATSVTITGTYKSSSSWFDLNFDGVADIDSQIAAHNAANPEIPCTLTSGDGTQIPNNLVNIYEEGTDVTRTASRIAKLSTAGVFNTTFETNMGDTSLMYDISAILVDGGYYYVFGAIKGFDTEQYDTIGRINDDGTYDAWFYPVALNDTWTAPAGVTEIIVVPGYSPYDLRISSGRTISVTPNTTYSLTVNSSAFAINNPNSFGSVFYWSGSGTLYIAWVE
jgi:hypothetical protein